MQIQRFLRPGVADQVVADDNSAMRAQGAAVVALQLKNSSAFSNLVWYSAVLGGGVALWLKSWIPIISAAVILAAAFYRLIISMARKVEKAGILLDYQAAYKRLYYNDAEFKRQVDDLRARNK